MKGEKVDRRKGRVGPWPNPPEPRPCPFCGGPGVMVYVGIEAGRARRFLGCFSTVCEFRPRIEVGGYVSTAVRRWNTRAEDAEGAAMLAELEKAMRDRVERRATLDLLNGEPAPPAQPGDPCFRCCEGEVHS